MEKRACTTLFNMELEQILLQNMKTVAMEIYILII